MKRILQNQHRKMVILTIIHMILSTSLFAQSPQMMNYQAVIRNASDDLVSNQTIGMNISILQGNIDGTAIYVETQNPTTNINGLATLEIGNGNVISGNFSTIDWSDGPFFIKTMIDLLGGSIYTITGTSQLLSVPYALYAEKAGNIEPDDQQLSVSDRGDTLYISDGNWIIVPGISPNLSVTDIDGNVYSVVVIGSQTWMAENLRTTKFCNGLEIPRVIDHNAWNALTTIAWTYYDNDINNDSIYGKLYNWYVASEVKNVCPCGWHVPSDEEWTKLAIYLGNTGGAGGKLKEVGLEHWFSPNTAATNTVGFTALPGGGRHSNGDFEYIGTIGLFWTSTPDPTITDKALIRTMNYNDGILYSNPYNIRNGISIRCVKD